VEDYRVLASCAEMVVRRLEASKFEVLEAAADDKLLRSLDVVRRPLLLADLGARGWPVLHANDSWMQSMGAPMSRDSSCLTCSASCCSCRAQR